MDLVYYGNQRQLEYDFVVAPGADPNQIKLSFAGADGMRVDAASGDWCCKVGDDEVRFHKPCRLSSRRRRGSFPQAGGLPAAFDRARHRHMRHSATHSGTFVWRANNQVAFAWRATTPSAPLVIDPVLSYSTYLGGSGETLATASPSIPPATPT